MTRTATNRLLLDSSTVVKWKLTSEQHASQAQELFLDWRRGILQVCAPDQLFVELVSALLGACRKHPPRLTAAEARQALDDLIGLPFTVFKTRSRRVLPRALEIAHQYNLRAYDCVYVALAERKRLDLWTADERLFNALHAAFPFLRRIADYLPRRPLP